MDEDGGGFFDGSGIEFEPYVPEWLDRSDDYNVWEENQVFLDNEGGEDAYLDSYMEDRISGLGDFDSE